MQLSILVVYPNTLYPSFKILEFHFFNKMLPGFLKTSLENILRAVIVLSTVVIGVLSINRFDTILALAGCAIMTPIALIFPTLFHYSLFKKSQSAFASIFDLFITFVGVSLSLTILIFTII